VYKIKHQAAFINIIDDEGDMSEAIEWLHRTWDDYMNLRLALIKLGYSKEQINQMRDHGDLRPDP
jgi:hypothetical protein